MNKCEFEMLTIYIPDNELTRKTQCVNQIDVICSQIEKAINGHNPEYIEFTPKGLRSSYRIDLCKDLQPMT